MSLRRSATERGGGPALPEAPVGPTAPPAPGEPPWLLAWLIAAGQIVSWGILYYTFAVVVGPMEADTGWSRPRLNAGLSLGLLVWGLCAVPVGAWIQRGHGRAVMAGGAALGALALIALGATTHPAAYFLAWTALGAAMAATLYEPAFAVIAAAFGEHHRRGIILVTLVGGFAGTVFMPLAQLGVDRFGWRATLIALGAAQLAVCVPLHALGLPRGAGSIRRSVMRQPTDSPPRHLPPAAGSLPFARWLRDLRHDLRDRRFLGLALWFTAHAAAFSGLIFQLVPMLQRASPDRATMLQTLALIGPMQVAGRLAFAAGSRSLSSLRAGAWALIGLCGALLTLLLAPLERPWLLMFAALFGASNGVMTIVRGTAVAEMFGRERYAEMNGALTLPAMVAKAVSPLALAAVATATGRPEAALVGSLLVFATAGGAGLWLAREKR